MVINFIRFDDPKTEICISFDGEQTFKKYKQYFTDIVRLNAAFSFYCKKGEEEELSVFLDMFKQYMQTEYGIECKLCNCQADIGFLLKTDTYYVLDFYNYIVEFDSYYADVKSNYERMRSTMEVVHGKFAKEIPEIFTPD